VKKYAKLCLLVILMVAMIINFSGCSKKEVQKDTKNSTKEVQEDTKIRFNYGLPEKHDIAYQLQDWVKLVSEKDNTLKFEVYPSAQLYKDADAIEAVITGAIESAHVYSFNMATIVEEFSIFDCPFLFNSTELMAKVVNSPIREKMDASASRKGLKILGYLYWAAESQGVDSTKFLKVPEDAIGLNGRVIGPESAALWEHWGMNPSFMSGSEVYMALQRGVIQTTHANIMSVIDRKLYEVAPNMTILPIGVVVSCIVINEDFFDKLPAAQQKALMDVAAEVEAKSVGLAKENNEAMLKRAAELKVNIYMPTPEEMKLWTANEDEVINKIYKERPNALAIIKEIQKMK